MRPAGDVVCVIYDGLDGVPPPGRACAMQRAWAWPTSWPERLLILNDVIEISAGNPVELRRVEQAQLHRVIRGFMCAHGNHSPLVRGGHRHGRFTYWSPH